MARYGLWLLLLLAAGVISAPTRAADGAGAHAFSFTSIEGTPLALANYAGRPLLVVNTASLCGYTYQYAALQRLWSAFAIVVSSCWACRRTTSAGRSRARPQRSRRSAR